MNVQRTIGRAKMIAGYQRMPRNKGVAVVDWMPQSGSLFLLFVFKGIAKNVNLSAAVPVNRPWFPRHS